MALWINLPSGKTRLFDNILDYLEATEDGYQSLMADNIGSEFDHTSIASASGTSLEIEGEVIDEWTPEEDK